MLRFTTSSTSSLDINTLRVALLNYIKSHQESTGFLLRIYDIDSSVEGEEQITIDILKKFAIDTENIFYQSKNLSIYQQMAKRLVDEDRAFACFCNNSLECSCESIAKETLQGRIANGEKFKLCIKKPLKDIRFKDNIQGEITHKADEIGSFTILTSDGKPTALFASAVDDMSNGITTVIEEVENSISTAKILYLQEQFGYKSTTQYFHIPTLDNSESKAPTIKYLLQEGYLPDAIIEYLLSLTAPIEKEIYYLPDAIESFDFSKIAKKSNRDFSLEELREYNRKHLKNMDAKKLSSIFAFADNDIGELLKLYLENAATINELEEYFRPLFKKKKCNDVEKALSRLIIESPYFKEYESFKTYLLKKSNLSEKELEQALRKLLTGREKGPNLDIIYNYLKSYVLEVAQCH